MLLKCERVDEILWRTYKKRSSKNFNRRPFDRKTGVSLRFFAARSEKLSTFFISPIVRHKTVVAKMATDFFHERATNV